MLPNHDNTAIIIGAGPAGLTAAYELLSRTDIRPIILEKSDEIGGISRTVNYKGNRIDIGGHRFFSKSKRVREWWQLFAPMLQKNRYSRIFYLRTFFDYPIKLNMETLSKLGLIRVFRIFNSYVQARLFPIKTERSLEDFFINRFGKELYLTFFKDYTEKVWGIACDQIKPEWGVQRIKGLSISKAIYHAIRSKKKKKNSSAEHKGIETSLIDRFMYPRLGPGQLWEEVAIKVVKEGGMLVMQQEVVDIRWLDHHQVEVKVKDTLCGEIRTYFGNYLFSTMPIKDLISSMHTHVSIDLKRVSEGLAYRDFITVGLLVKKLNIKEKSKNLAASRLIRDNWIYIQEKDVSLGRLQIFNNWSPDMLADQDNVWLGLEYFCNEGDELWSMPDSKFISFAIAELQKLEMIVDEDVLDSTIIRVPKAYPAYFGTYNELNKITNFTDSFKNMFLIGRNGMHKYNNQDHSMLSAMVAVDQIIAGDSDKSKIWKVNAETEYHESGSEE